MKGSRWATAFFITRADFTTCGRNILPDPNRSPTTFMPSISGPSITSIGRANSCRASSVSSTMCASMPLTSAWASRSLDRPAAPFGRLLLLDLVGPAIALGQRDQPLGGVVAAVEDDILARLAKLGVDLVINVELAGVDDGHVHAGGDGVVEEHRMHRPAHRLIAAEREAEVATGRPRCGRAGSARGFPWPPR